jgi:hypothetical protein
MWCWRRYRSSMQAARRCAEAVLDFAQGEQPAVGAQVPGIEPGDDRLAADR